MPEPLMLRVVAFSTSTALLLVLLIMFLTRDESTKGSSPLHRLYGYENVCVVFDKFPERAVISVAFPFFVEAPMLAWWVSEVPLADTSNFGRNVLLGWLPVVLWLLVRNVFVLDPVEQGVLAHTLPFLALVAALTLMAARDAVVTDSWGTRAFSWGVVALGVAKLAYTTAALVRNSSSEQALAGAEVVDLLWVLAVVPGGLVAAIVRLCYSKKRRVGNASYYPVWLSEKI
jgi:hypothetical protein